MWAVKYSPISDYRHDLDRDRVSERFAQRAIEEHEVARFEHRTRSPPGMIEWREEQLERGARWQAFARAEFPAGGRRHGDPRIKRSVRGIG